MIWNDGFSEADLRIFALLQDGIKEGDTSIGPGGRGSADFMLTAPDVPGEYDISVLASSGDLATESIEVVEERNLMIESIEHPDIVTDDGSCAINVTVYNSGEARVARLRFQSEDISGEAALSLEKDGMATHTFNCSGESEGRKAVSVSLLDSSGSYQDGWTGNIEFRHTPSLKDAISNQLEGFIMWITELIRGLFGS